MIYGWYGRKDNLAGVKAFLKKRPANFTGQVPRDALDGYPGWKQTDIGDKPLEYTQEKEKLWILL
jgi:hypothetical protein